jgi:hypothetical protein
MAVIGNRNSRQNPITSGRTGTQIVKFVPAPRVYIKAADSITAATIPYVKSDGVTPAGFTDLGIVEGLATITYNKEIKEVLTGIDQVLRQSYVGRKTASIQFNLSQFDDTVFENISGLTASTIISGSTINYQVGSEDIITKALLLVVQNKLDGKEMQLYNPAADLSFTFNQNGDYLELQVTGNMKAFTASGAALESFYSLSFFA